VKNKTIFIIFAIILSCSLHASAGSADTSFSLPCPLIFAVDDVGWAGDKYIGENGRSTVIEDYEVLKYVGEKTGHRIMCLFVMGDFDKNDVLASYPTTNESGSAWNIDPQQNADAKITFVKENAAWIEFGYHAVRHSVFLNDSVFADEFYNLNAGETWPDSQVNGHIECFEKLLAQYTLPFPESFVAPSHAYYFNLEDPEDTGGKLYRKGIRYANNCFWCFRTENPPMGEGGVIDNGVLFLDRMGEEICNCQNDDCAPASYAEWPFGVQETHWTNWLNSDPLLNKQSPGDAYIAWYKGVNTPINRYLPKNTAQCYSQWLYKKYSVVSGTSGNVTINNTGMPDDAYNYDLLSTIVIKVNLNGLHVSNASIDNSASISAYYEDSSGHGYIIIGHRSRPMGRLDKKVYQLTYELGLSKMPLYVDITAGTYNVFGLSFQDSAAYIRVEMYGTQNIPVKLPFIPGFILSNNTDLVINKWNFDTASSTCTVNVTGKNIQGETGTIIIATEADISTLPVNHLQVFDTDIRPFKMITGQEIKLLGKAGRTAVIYDTRGAVTGRAVIAADGRLIFKNKPASTNLGIIRIQ
jgi:hypothetical protein